MSPKDDLAAFYELYKMEPRKVIKQNSTCYFDFAPDYSTTLVSEGFEGCFGVIITTRQGCIIAHMSQTSLEVNKAKEKISDILTEHPDLRSDPMVYIYAEVNYPNETEMGTPALYNDLQKFLTTTIGASPRLVKYIQSIYAACDSEGYDLPGKDSSKMESGKLAIKCGKDQSSEPTVSFITLSMQLDVIKT